MKPSIFLGSSSEHGLSIARRVQADLQDVARCKIWNQGVFGLGWAPVESLMNEVPKHDFAVLIFTPDDIVVSRQNPEISAPRDNVIFELGLFMGRLGPKRAFIIYDASVNIKILSDLQGITRAPYDGEWAKSEPAAAVGPACTSVRDSILAEGFFFQNENIIKYGDNIGLVTFNHWFVQTNMDSRSAYKLQTVEREQLGTWETFELVDPENSIYQSSKKPLRLGDKIGLKGFNHKYIGANLDVGQEPLLYAWENEYLGKEWNKFVICPCRPGAKAGDFVRYGDPIALQAHNSKYVAFRYGTDWLLWAAADAIGEWEQFILVHGNSSFP